jgi:hypothetical protein
VTVDLSVFWMVETLVETMVGAKGEMRGNETVLLTVGLRGKMTAAMMVDK